MERTDNLVLNDTSQPDDGVNGFAYELECLGF